MRKLPPLNAVRTFEAVARHQSFTAAAEELSVTVAAVSLQVKLLEDRVGQKLLERGRVITLTIAGKMLYLPLQDALDQIEQAFAFVAPPIEGDSIHVSTTRAFAERWLLPRLTQFNEKYPDIIVHLHASEKVIDLRSAAIDLAIRYGAVDMTQNETVLFEDNYIAVVDKQIGPEYRQPTITDCQQHSLLAFKWKNTALEAPSWSTWLALTMPNNIHNFRIAWYSEETLALQALEQGFGPLLCSSVLINDALTAGVVRQLAGPALPGFTYRLIENPVSRRRSIMIFTDWLQNEVEQFRLRTSMSGINFVL